jgi:hypothetical protein
MIRISKILLCLTVTLIAVPSQTSLVMAQEPVKIFAMQRPDVEPKADQPELNDPNIYGISWRFRWAKIEPAEGQYNWSPVDHAMAITSKAGKKVMLRLTAGISSPEWVYRGGAKPFDFRNTDLRHPENHPPDMRMPVPWDEVYLAKWEAFVQAFGKRYNGNPTIYSIQMTGGGYIGEMNLPKAFAKWEQVGYSDDKLIGAWKRIIDTYQRAFPDTPTNLDINEPLGNRSKVLGPVVSYVLAKYPRKVYLQQNGLRADLPRDDHIRRILREAASQTLVGYQMVGGKGFLEKQTGDRMTAFRNALEDRVSYLEIYSSDVRDPGQRGALQSLTTRPEKK